MLGVKICLGILAFLTCIVAISFWCAQVHKAVYGMKPPTAMTLWIIIILTVLTTFPIEYFIFQ